MAAKTRLAAGEKGKDITAGPVSLLQCREPGVNVFASLILGVSVPLLQPTFELVALAVDGG